MPVGGAAFILSSISVGLGLFMATLIVLSDCLEVVVGCGDVMGCGKMMVLARRMALGLSFRHGSSFQVESSTLSNKCSIDNIQEG